MLRVVTVFHVATQELPETDRELSIQGRAERVGESTLEIPDGRCLRERVRRGDAEQESSCVPFLDPGADVAELLDGLERELTRP